MCLNNDSAEKVEPGYKASMISVPKVRILLALAMRSFHDVKKDIQQLEKALQYTSEAESLLRHIEDYRMKGETFELRGRLFGFKGEFEKAKEYFLKALQTFEENNSTPKVYLICFNSKPFFQLISFAAVYPFLFCRGDFLGNLGQYIVENKNCFFVLGRLCVLQT